MLLLLVVRIEKSHSCTAPCQTNYVATVLDRPLYFPQYLRADACAAMPIPIVGGINSYSNGVGVAILVTILLYYLVS